MAVYCTADQLFSHVDENDVRDLLSDSGQKISGDLSTNPKLVELIKAASGRLEGACFIGDNYTPEELAAMTPNSLALAAEIVAMLVRATLYGRRPGRYAVEFVRDLRQQAEDYLGQLRDGHRLFDVGTKAHQDAGHVSLEYPTTLQIEDQNLITQRTRNFYPLPERRLPISKGGG